MLLRLCGLCLALIGLATPTLGSSAQAHVAVAANFAEPMKAIAAELKKYTGHQLKITLGATGKLYAQIKNGAPFDVLLAADSQTPARLVAEGFATTGDHLTYATGKLVLWSADAAKVDAQGDILVTGNFRKVAFASPKVAPYGAAAVQVMDNLGLRGRLEPKLVQGESIGQTFNFVYTGNADIGFVALSQVMENGRLKSGSLWVIPQTLYDPIRQDAVILQRGANNPAAHALMALLKSPSTQALIRGYGFDI